MNESDALAFLGEERVERGLDVSCEAVNAILRHAGLPLLDKNSDDTPEEEHGETITRVIERLDKMDERDLLVLVGIITYTFQKLKAVATMLELAALKRGITIG